MNYYKLAKQRKNDHVDVALLFKCGCSMKEDSTRRLLAVNSLSWYLKWKSYGDMEHHAKFELKNFINYIQLMHI